MNPYIRILIINLLLLVTLSGCKNDPLRVDISDISLEVVVHRFDRELFTLDFDTVGDAVSEFYMDYGDFFDVFNVHVINIGPASQKYYGSYLSMFVNDPQNFDVYEYTQEVFPDLEQTERVLTEGFKRYLVHYPDSAVPQLVGYVSRFNHKLFTIGNTIGIGLDQYLGRDCAFYDLLGTPQYMQRNMVPEKIPADVAQVWASALYPYNDSIDNALNRMIHKGMMLYFTDAMFPGMADSLKVGFTTDQLKFCRANEAQMWTYLVENDLLFSTDPLEIRKLTEEAPTTFYFPKASPGRAAVWLGWQIVREYARRNPELGVPEIMMQSNYLEILQQSRYNP